MIFLLKNWKIITGGALAFVFFIGLLWVWSRGYEEAKSDILAKENKAIVEAFIERESLENEVTRLPIDDLKRRYCKWVRDSEQECLQANIPISKR